MDSPPIPFHATTTFAYISDTRKKKGGPDGKARKKEERQPLIPVELVPATVTPPAATGPAAGAQSPSPGTDPQSTCSSIIQSHLRVNPDKLLDSYGKFGKMQVLGHLLCQYLTILYSSSLFIVNLISNQPNTTCTDKDGHFIADACADLSKCVEGSLNVTDTVPVGSIFVWFNITCGSFFMNEAGSTAYVMGAMIVVPIFCRLADRYGRKPLLLSALIASLFVNCLIPLAPWYWLYIVLRFLLGATSDAYLSISALLTVEFICQDARSWISLFSTTGFAMGILWIGSLSIFISDWQTLYAAMITPAFLTVLYFCCLTESPFWLAAHDQTHDLKEYCRKANKLNKVNVSYKACIEEKGKPAEKHVRFRDLMKHRDIVKGLVINGFCAFTLAFSYYSVSFMSNRFTDGYPTMSFMILAAAEIPGGVLSIVLMEHFGRRTLVIVSLVLQGVALFVTPFLDVKSTLVLISLSFLKIFNSMCYAIHPIFVAEGGPTSIRSLVASVINIPQSLGMLTAPFFKYAVEWNPHVSFVTLAVQSSISGALLLLLKETKGLDLPEDLDDLKRDRSQYNRKLKTGDATACA